MNEIKQQSFNRKIKRRRPLLYLSFKMPFAVFGFFFVFFFLRGNPLQTLLFLDLQTHNTNKQYITNVCKIYVPGVKRHTLTNYFECITSNV